MLPPEAVALVDALLATDPADRPTAVEVLELLGAAPPAIAEAADRHGRGGRAIDGSVPRAAPDGSARAPDASRCPQAPSRPADGRRRGRDRRRRRPRLRRRHDRERRPRRRGAAGDRDDRAAGAQRARRGGPRRSRRMPRSPSAGAPTPSPSPAGDVIAQTPQPATRVERAALDLVVRVSRGTAFAAVPDVEGASAGGRRRLRCGAPASPHAFAPRSRGRCRRAASSRATSPPVTRRGGPGRSGSSSRAARRALPFPTFAARRSTMRSRGSTAASRRTSSRRARRRPPPAPSCASRPIPASARCSARP